MALCKPILLTDFSTAKDQIENEKTGLIVPMTPEGIEHGLSRLLQDKALRERLQETLSRCDLSNTEEIEKLYALLEGPAAGAPARGQKG